MYRYDNIKREYGATASRRRIVRLKLEKGGKCERCGYDRNFAALAFHHRIGKKKFGVLPSSSPYHKIAESKEEMKKCILVCRNCHMELHHPKLDKSQLQEILCDKRKFKRTQEVKDKISDTLKNKRKRVGKQWLKT